MMAITLLVALFALTTASPAPIFYPGVAAGGHGISVEQSHHVTSGGVGGLGFGGGIVSQNVGTKVTTSQAGGVVGGPIVGPGLHPPILPVGGGHAVKSVQTSQHFVGGGGLGYGYPVGLGGVGVGKSVVSSHVSTGLAGGHILGK